jgi:hypothetical protein
LKLGFRCVTADVRPEVDISEVLVVPRDGKDADGVQKRPVNSERSSGCLIASSRRGEWRLEKARMTVCFGRHQGARLAVEQGKKRCQGDAPCRGKTAGRRRGARGHRRQRIRPEEPADAAEAGEQFEQPGGAIQRERRGRMDRRGRAFIGVARGRNRQVLIEN